MNILFIYDSRKQLNFITKTFYPEIWNINFFDYNCDTSFYLKNKFTCIELEKIPDDE